MPKRYSPRGLGSRANNERGGEQRGEVVIMGE